MNPFLRILIGFIVLLLGTSMVYKTNWYLELLGRVYWAEKNLGGGGSQLFYKIFGIGVILIGMIIMTDLSDRLIGSFLVNLFTF